MSTKSERKAAREEVAAYHEARLAELVQRVGEAVDRFRTGEVDAFEVDRPVPTYLSLEEAAEYMSVSV